MSKLTGVPENDIRNILEGTFNDLVTSLDLKSDDQLRKQIRMTCKHHCGILYDLMVSMEHMPPHARWKELKGHMKRQRKSFGKHIKKEYGVTDSWSAR